MRLPAEEKKKIFGLFKGMDAEVQAIIDEYRRVASKKNVYAQEYIDKARQEAKKQIQAVKRRYASKALEALDILEGIYANQGKKNPLPDRTELFRKSPDVISEIPLLKEQLLTMDQMAYQLQRQNNLMKWGAILPVADEEELRSLYEEHGHDDDFRALLRAELKKREKTPALAELQLMLDNPVPVAGEIQSLRGLIDGHVVQDDTAYWARLDEGFDSAEYHRIDDLLDGDGR